MFKNRFDKMIYLGIPQGKEQRKEIIKSQLRKINHSIDIETLIDSIPLNLTGADFYGISQSAIQLSIKRKIKIIDQLFDKRENKEETFNTFVQRNLEKDASFKDIQMIQEDYREALEKCTPSVSMAELMKYEKLR